MKGMAQDGHREWAGRGQARLRQENSRTASGTSHKMQNKKKSGGMDMGSLGRT